MKNSSKADYVLMRVHDFVALPAPRPAAVLLDRLWPRGISKENMAGVAWEKDATPSTELRMWFHADPDGRFEAAYAGWMQRRHGWQARPEWVEWCPSLCNAIALMIRAFTAPGDGDYDYPAFMAALKSIDYSGWIVIEAEQDPAVANPRNYSQLGLDTLKRLAAETGLA